MKYICKSKFITGVIICGLLLYLVMMQHGSFSVLTSWNNLDLLPFQSHESLIVESPKATTNQRDTSIQQRGNVLKKTVDNPSTAKALKISLQHLRNRPTDRSQLNLLRINKPNNALFKNLDCKGVIDGNQIAVKVASERVASMNSEPQITQRNTYISSVGVEKWTKNCSEFKFTRKYLTQPMSEEENDFPLAYIISIYKDVFSFENLLRLIYHPQNIYCVHIDQKSDREFQRKVEEIVDCFDNVFLASTMTKVYYTHWTIVQSSLNCMTDLIERKKEHEWRFVFNLCGYDYPTKTNLEIVRALKNLNGTNCVQSSEFLERNRARYLYKYRLPNIVTGHEYLVSTNVKTGPPPHGIKVFAGSDYFIWTREAVEYFMRDSKIKDFFEWSKDTLIPEELVWATLQRMYPQVPGSVPQTLEFTRSEDDVMTRTRIWRGSKRYQCKSNYIRDVCIFGVKDLNWLVNQHGVFANKLDSQSDLIAAECLTEWIRNRTLKLL